MSEINTRQTRQGDVLLQAIESLPAGAFEIPLEHGAAVLAYGEVTGHKHQVLAGPGVKLFGVPGSLDRFVVVGGDAPVHELEEYEHATIGASYVDRCCGRGTPYPGAVFTRTISAAVGVTVHDEHNIVPLAPGIYRSSTPFEYTPGAIQRVVD